MEWNIKAKSGGRFGGFFWTHLYLQRGKFIEKARLQFRASQGLRNAAVEQRLVSKRLCQTTDASLYTLSA